MKTRKTLILMASLLMISLASLAQTTPQKAGYPGRIVTDTNFLKKAMHIQIWKDTSSTMQFIIWHDTVYLLMLHAEVNGREKLQSGKETMAYLGAYQPCVSSLNLHSIDTAYVIRRNS